MSRMVQIGLAALLLALALAAQSAPANVVVVCHQGGPDGGPGCPGRVGGTQHGSLPPASVDGIDLPQVPGFHEEPRDYCAWVAGWAKRHHTSAHGVAADYYWVWAMGHAAAVVCGHKQEVWGHTNGPGSGNSLPCPVVTRGGQTVQTRPFNVGWWVSERRHFGSVHGSFGRNNDGFWDYRFHNPQHGTVRARLYGYCR